MIGALATTQDDFPRDRATLNLNPRSTGCSDLVVHFGGS